MVGEVSASFFAWLGRVSCDENTLSRALMRVSFMAKVRVLISCELSTGKTIVGYFSF